MEIMGGTNGSTQIKIGNEIKISVFYNKNLL
jgi:hypothetical protein